MNPVDLLTVEITPTRTQQAERPRLASEPSGPGSDGSDRPVLE